MGGYGGSHQFLNALRKQLIVQNNYTYKPEDADVILFNSSQNLFKTLKLKYKYKDKIFIQRVDGPIKLYNTTDDIRDELVYLLNEMIADGTVFQSKWSKEMNRNNGMKKNFYEKIIMNAPDNELFYRNGNKIISDKVKIISTSWSSNPKKGYETYKWLDENLDFKKYDYFFIGNSNTKFRNILDLGPLGREDIAKRLRESDIYIGASEKETCSNALIEAINSGLPAIVLNDGGNPEIIGNSGELFNKKEEIIPLLEKIHKDYTRYQKLIKSFSINEVTNEYLELFTLIKDEKDSGRYKSKQINILEYIHCVTLMKLKILINKIKRIVKGTRLCRR